MYSRSKIVQVRKSKEKEKDWILQIKICEKFENWVKRHKYNKMLKWEWNSNSASTRSTCSTILFGNYCGMENSRNDKICLCLLSQWSMNPSATYARCTRLLVSGESYEAVMMWMPTPMSIVLMYFSVVFLSLLCKKCRQHSWWWGKQKAATGGGEGRECQPARSVILTNPPNSHACFPILAFNT